jgi:Pyruvate/2-oxoacid:ferredoxin oxidoreductase delta subunit
MNQMNESIKCKRCALYVRNARIVTTNAQRYCYIDNNKCAGIGDREKLHLCQGFIKRGDTK